MFILKSTHATIIEKLEAEHKMKIQELEHRLKLSESECDRLTNLLTHAGAPDAAADDDPGTEQKDADLERIDNLIKVARNWSPIRMADRALKRKTLADLGNEREKILRKINAGSSEPESRAAS